MGTFVWKIEVRGRGVQPYEFATERDAKDFAEATYPWIGVSWRYIKVIKQEKESVKNES